MKRAALQAKDWRSPETDLATSGIGELGSRGQLNQQRRMNGHGRELGQTECLRPRENNSRAHWRPLAVEKSVFQQAAKGGRFCPFVVGMFLAFAAGQTLAAPGAKVPWTTYEAEDMACTGLVLGPKYGPNEVESESSGRKCVKLQNTGEYVEFVARASANALVMRYSIPDSPDGQGNDASLSLYLNGARLKQLPVTSRYSWLYGHYPFTNAPGNLPRNFYDEVRLKGIRIQAGDKVRLQKDRDNAAAYYIIDLVDLEWVAPPLARPSGPWRAITDPPYNAAGNGVADDTAALQNCINDARQRGYNVWVPPGTYVLSADITNLADVTVQGAGMWHTTFLGDAAQYNDNSNRRVRFNGSGNNVHLADFAILGRLRYRDDHEANDGLDGSFGTGSTLSRIWVEHTKTGAWIANSSGLVIDGCRIRNTIADGINLCVGVRNSIVTNCATRGTGDDCFAMWPATYTRQVYKPGSNVFTHCTAQLPFLANGGALYGGEGNRIEDCLFCDMPYGCGVLLSGTFPVGTNIFSGTTSVQRCDLIRCGGYDPFHAWRAAFQFMMEKHQISDVCMGDLNIIDSISDGLSIVADNPLTNATLSHLNMPNFGIGAPGRHGLWAQTNSHGSLVISNSIAPEYKNESAGFAFNFVNVTFSTNMVGMDRY